MRIGPAIDMLKADQFEKIRELRRELEALTENHNAPEFREETKWLEKECNSVAERAEKREEFARLEILITGIILPDRDRQKTCRRKLEEIEEELEEAASSGNADPGNVAKLVKRSQSFLLRKP